MKRKFILTSLALTFCMGMYAEQPVTVETDSMRRIDLEEVMIHATKTGALLKDLPNRVEVVTKRQIEASGINNLTDLLKNFVNVDVIEYPGYNSYFSIRGFKPTEGKYTTVLIDGVPAGTYQYGDTFFRRCRAGGSTERPFLRHVWFGCDGWSGEHCHQTE